MKNILSEQQISNFDYYYNDEQNLKKERILKVLNEQIQDDQDNIMNFLQHRDKESIKLQELIYCYQQIISNETMYANILENMPEYLDKSFQNIPNILKKELNSLEDIDNLLNYLVIFKKSQFLININDDKIWLEIMKQIMNRQHSLEKNNDYNEDNTLQMLSIYQNIIKAESLQKMQIKTGLLKMQKYLIKGVEFLNIQQMIDFMLISAKKHILLEDMKIKEFDVIFEEQFNSLTPQQISDILYCYTKFDFQLSILTESVINYINIFIKNIEIDSFKLYFQNYEQQKQQELYRIQLENLQKNQQYEEENNEDMQVENQKIKDLQEIIESNDQKSPKFIRNIDQFMMIKVSEQDYYEQLHSVSLNLLQYVSFVHSFSQLKNFKQINYIWKKMEKLFSEFVVKVKNFEIFESVPLYHVQTIIKAFDKIEGTSKLFWLQNFDPYNCREFGLNQNDNFIVLKNLTLNHKYYSKEHLNLTFSFLLKEYENQRGEIEELPQFSYLNQKQPDEILLIYHAYFINIFDQVNQSEEITKNIDKLFYLKSLKNLTFQVSKSIMQVEKNFKSFTRSQMHELYNIFMFSQFLCKKFFSEIQKELDILERSMFKLQHDFGSIDISKLVMLVDFEEQNRKDSLDIKQPHIIQRLNEKMDKIMIYFLQTSTEVELVVLFGQFYKYNMQNPYFWSILQIKIIEIMEQISITDLLIIQAIINQVNPEFIDEDYIGLFLEVLEIKINYINLLDLTTFINNFSCTDVELGEKILSKLNYIQKDLKENSHMEIYNDEVSELEYNASFITRVTGITLQDVINYNYQSLNTETKHVDEFIRQKDPFAIKL